MLIAIRSLFALLCSGALLLAGGGLLTTLLALTARAEGFPNWVVGLLFSFFSVGFMAGCLYVPRMIRAVGHIRVFAALAAVTSAAAVSYLVFVDAGVWLFLRAINGFCLAGLSMVIESWLNDRADNKNRGQLLAIYRVVDLSSVTVGQLLLVLGGDERFLLFAVVSICISLAVVPVALTRAITPAPVAAVKLDLKRLWQVSPLAMVSCLGVGMGNGAFWALAPVFAAGQGLTEKAVALFMATTIVGGALIQYPIGMLSDRFDRRAVLVGVTMAAALASLALAHTSGGAVSAIFVSAFLFGATAMPIYGLAIAHANDTADAGDFVRISSGLLLSYSIGAMVGPILAGGLMEPLGLKGLFIHIAFIQAAIVVFGFYRMTQRRTVPVQEQADFVSVPRTTPEIFRMDPRSLEEGAPEEDETAAPPPSGNPPAPQQT